MNDEILADPNTSRGLKGPFEGMKFPRYVFSEYPKLVRTASGKKLVRDENEEIRLRSDGTAMDAPEVNPFEKENKELREKVLAMQEQVNGMLKAMQKTQGTAVPAKPASASPHPATPSKTASVSAASAPAVPPVGAA